MNITVTGIHEGIVKDLRLEINPNLTVDIVKKELSNKLGINDKLLQLKQGNFYFNDEESIIDIMKLDKSQFSFEIGSISIPIDILYGSRRICMSVDCKCTIGILKARFSSVLEYLCNNRQIFSASNSSMSIAHALHDGVLCSDSSTIEELGVTPFSPIFLCSDLYEMIVDLPDKTSITLYKDYYVSFYSVIEEISKHCNTDPLLLSVNLISPCHKSLSTCTEQLFKLFDSNQIRLQVLRTSLPEMATIIQNMEKTSQTDGISDEAETAAVDSSHDLEKEIGTLQLEINSNRRSYVDRMTSLLGNVNALNTNMEEMLRMVDELDSIRRDQRELLRQCEMLERMGEMVPEVWSLARSVDDLDISINGALGKDLSICKKESPYHDENDISTVLLPLSGRPDAVLPSKSHSNSPPVTPSSQSPTPLPYRMPSPNAFLSRSCPPMPPLSTTVQSRSSPTSSPSLQPSSAPVLTPGLVVLSSSATKASSLIPQRLPSTQTSPPVILKRSSCRTPPPMPPHQFSPKLSDSALQKRSSSISTPPPIPPPPIRSRPQIPSQPPPEVQSEMSSGLRNSTDEGELHTVRYSCVSSRSADSAENIERNGMGRQLSVAQGRSLSMESGEIEEKIEIIKPSQLRGNSALLNKINTANLNRSIGVPYSSVKKESSDSDSMPNLHKEFSPPIRPKKQFH